MTSTSIFPVVVKSDIRQQRILNLYCEILAHLQELVINNFLWSTPTQNKIELNEYEKFIVEKFDFVHNYQLMGSITFKPSNFPKKEYSKRNTSTEAKSVNPLQFSEEIDQ